MLSWNSGSRCTNKWEAYHTARREAQRAQNLVDTLSAMAKPVRPPVGVDTLTHSPADTARLLSDCTEEQQRLQSRISQYKGRMEALGDRAQLEKQLASVNARLAELEKTYTALTIAQETLAQARSELQRRFAPRISQRAQTYLSAMTGGRYQRLSMGEDFSLQAGTGDEETLHDALWRSDGTIDQLYLALRLAVAEELTPDSPLILDDALVRFDDTRMQAALAILEDMAKSTSGHSVHLPAAGGKCRKRIDIVLQTAEKAWLSPLFWKIPMAFCCETFPDFLSFVIIL